MITVTLNEWIGVQKLIVGCQIKKVVWKIIPFLYCVWIKAVLIIRSRCCEWRSKMYSMELSS